MHHANVSKWNSLKIDDRGSVYSWTVIINNSSLAIWWGVSEWNLKADDEQSMVGYLRFHRRKDEHKNATKMQGHVGNTKFPSVPRVNAVRPERDGYITVDNYHGNCPPAWFPRSLHPPVAISTRRCMINRSASRHFLIRRRRYHANVYWIFYLSFSQNIYFRN